MPGENCGVLGCSTSFKHKIAIFKVPTKGNEDSIDKMKKVIDLITRDRVIDKSLQSQIEKTLFIFDAVSLPFVFLDTLLYAFFYHKFQKLRIILSKF